MVWALLVACHGRGNDPSRPPVMTVDGELVFEDVDIGTDGPRVATLWVENIGHGLLTVDGPYFAVDGAFSVAPESVALERMERHGYEITFDPRTPFLHEGWLVIDSNDPEEPSRSVAVRGEAFAPVLDVSVVPIDFGTPEIGCAAQQEIEVRNGGNEPLVVTPSLAGSSELDLDSGEPLEIEPSMSTAISLTYRPADATKHTATLTLESNDPIDPSVAVDLTGVGRARETRTDVFEVGPRQTDLVLIVDDSRSMRTEQAKLADHVDALVDALEMEMVDYHIGVISTDASTLHGPVVTPGTADPADALADQVAAVGIGGSGTPRALEMLYDCVQAGGDCSESAGFLREDALFAGIIVSDQPDQSAMNPESYVEYFWTLKDDPSLVRVHAFAGAIPVPTCGTCPSAGFGYDEAVELTDGAFIDICAGDWDASLQTLAEVSLGGNAAALPLGADPAVDTIVVEVDGVWWTGGWTYTGHHVEGGTNAIVFDPEAPRAGSVIEVRYELTAVCD